MTLVRSSKVEVDFLSNFLSRVPIATILHNASDLIMDNFLLCDGSILNKLLYPELFSLIGYTFGGSDNNFNLPDMRGRIPIGAGIKSLGNGSNSKTLLHNWSFNLSHNSHAHSLPHGINTASAAPSSHGLLGGDSENLPPYLPLNIIICYDDEPISIGHGLTRKTSKSFIAYREKIKSLIGTIAIYASDNIPNQWLLCDGSEVSRTIYHKLYSKISGNWGIGDGINTFNLPNFNNYLILGDNTTSYTNKNNINPGPKTKVPDYINPINHSSHRHTYNGPYNWVINPALIPFTVHTAYAATIPKSFANISYTVSDDLSGPHSHTITGGDAETVPDNVCGNYIIRVR